MSQRMGIGDTSCHVSLRMRHGSRLRSCCSQARALKEDLSPEATEAGIRVFARHGQHKRSVELLRGAVGKAAVSVETLQAVFTALLQANEPALALDLLQVTVNADTSYRKAGRQPACLLFIAWQSPQR